MEQKTRYSRKTVIKSIKKGGMWLRDIRQFINELKPIWIRKYLNANHKWKNIISLMFPIIRTLYVHGPCLLLKKQQIKFVLEAYITGL